MLGNVVRAPRLLLVEVIVACCLLGCGGASEILQPPVSRDTTGGETTQEGDLIVTWAPGVAGDWKVDVTLARDTCGIGSGLISREMEIAQRGKQLTLSPLDAAGGCGTFPVYLGSALEGSETWTRTVADGKDADACRVSVSTRFTLRFGSDAFTATEENNVTYVSGDCGEFISSCEWLLEATGAACRDCDLACAEPENRLRLGGPLGWPATIDLEALRNRP